MTTVPGASSSSNDIWIGEGFAGDGPTAAHVNTVLGERSGPVGTAWATALATPTPGHVPFIGVVRPNLPIVPMTLVVTKATIAGPRHGGLLWGAAQAGLAVGVGAALEAGHVPGDIARLVLIAAVWVDPALEQLDDDAHEEAVFQNNAEATAVALAMGFSGGPSASTVIDALRDPGPANPYFRRGRPTT